MTPTPDTALAARLAFLDTVAMVERDDNALEWALTESWRSGQLITLADHNDAVQAAVAKAVEAEREACASEAEAMASEYWGEYKNIMSPHAYDPHYQGMSDGAENAAAAIRARKGDAL